MTRREKLGCWVTDSLQVRAAAKSHVGWLQSGRKGLSKFPLAADPRTWGSWRISRAGSEAAAAVEAVPAAASHHGGATRPWPGGGATAGAEGRPSLQRLADPTANQQRTARPLGRFSSPSSTTTRASISRVTQLVPQHVLPQKVIVSRSINTFSQAMSRQRGTMPETLGHATHYRLMRPRSHRNQARGSGLICSGWKIYAGPLSRLGPSTLPKSLAWC